MKKKLREDAKTIYTQAIEAVLPEQAVLRALTDFSAQGPVYVFAVGKAAWRMAGSAARALGDRMTGGVVITKYGHAQGPIGKLEIYEAGHPVPDENTVAATRRAVELARSLTATDTVVFLLSGGGSALFEQPLIPLGELEEITKQLLACGADIVEMNTVRKRLSAVKGGRFAQLCAPAKIYAVILSDILGDPVDMIASGPCCADVSTCADALAVAEKYDLKLSAQARALLRRETPKALDNVHTQVTGSVRELCAAARRACEALGYETKILTDSLSCEARDAGGQLAAIAREHADTKKPRAFIMGGETVVRLTGTGKGGRNQELALAAAKGIDGLENAAVFSVGSDGTDGPTDAAGGYVDGATAAQLREKGIDIDAVLANNDAYPALKAVDSLIMTGPTGTNVNDFAALLLR